MAYYEFTIRIPDTFKDRLIRELSESGCLGVIENDENLIAYFPATLDITALQNKLSLYKVLLEKAGHAGTLTFQYTLIPQRDWNESWKKGFQPLDVGEHFTILPPWEQKRKDRINLVIDPGMAFGTGHHETTRSCLVLMEKYADKCGKESFLDLGTGTGVLAIAATKLGYRRVVGIDTDPLAVEAARKNIELNHVSNVELHEGSIVEASGTFDCIAANIVSGILISLASEISSRLNPEGMAIISGILTEQGDEVAAAFTQNKLRLIESLLDDKWLSLVFAKQP